MGLLASARSSRSLCQEMRRRKAPEAQMWLGVGFSRRRFPPFLVGGGGRQGRGRVFARYSRPAGVLAAGREARMEWAELKRTRGDTETMQVVLGFTAPSSGAFTLVTGRIDLE